MSARNTFAATRRSHAILGWLRRGDAVTINTVVENFNVQYPQAREDLKLLEELYDLHTHRDGRTKCWSWPGNTNPQNYTLAMAAALELGGIAMDVFRNTPQGEEIGRVIADCRQQVGQNHQARLDRLSNALHLRRTWLPTNPEAIFEALEDILNAIELEKQINIVYERSDGAVGSYHLTPRQLVWYQGRLWMSALDGQTSKLFDVAGIKEIDTLSEVRDQDADGDIDSERLALEAHDPVTHFAHAFGIYADNYPVHDIHLQVSGTWANYLRRYRLHPSQENTESAGDLHVRFQMGVCPEFMSFVMGMIPHVKVHEPTILKEQLQSRAQDWLSSL